MIVSFLQIENAKVKNDQNLNTVGSKQNKQLNSKAFVNSFLKVAFVMEILMFWA